MGLVNELQISAEQDDVLTVLRKTKRVSIKLGRNDICHWLDHEQNGFSDEDTIPDYRRVPITFCYNTNGYIPAGYGQVVNGIIPLPPGISEGCYTTIYQPICTVLEMIESMKAGNGLYESLPPQMTEKLRSLLKCNKPEFLYRVTFMDQLDNSHVRAIPEHIKNKVLDWACNLETAGVTGDGQSFSDNEKQTAQTVIFHIANSNIEQLNNSGRNIRGDL